MSKENTKTNLLEELYFSSGNSGLSLRILEKITKRTKDDGSVEETPRYRAEISHGAFGENSVMSFPLGVPMMAKMMAEAFTRTAQHMESQSNAGGRHSPFRHVNASSVFGVREGLRARTVYREEYVAGPFSTRSETLGVDWLDRQGHVVRFESLDELQESHAWVGSDSSGGESSESDPLYAEDEIGLTLREVAERRQGTGRHIPFFRTSSDTSRYVPPGQDPKIV